MTDYQLIALADLRDGEWHYGKEIRGWNSLSSLHKRGLVNKVSGMKGMKWQITPEGLKILKKHMPHLKFELTE